MPGREGADAVAYGIDYDDQPVGVKLPAPSLGAVSVGMVEWDLDGDRWSGDDDALSLLGVVREEFGGTMAEVEDRVSPDDLYELRAGRREAADTGQIRGRHFRVLEEAGDDGRIRYRPVELWGHVVRVEGIARLLVGALVDAAGGVTAAEAAERLPDGVFSLDQDGRIIYANRRCQELLGCDLDHMLGHYPWDVLPWLRDPAYEDRYRAAMLSQEPVSYLVHAPDGVWLGFVLYPGVHGLTGRVFLTSAPAGAEPGRSLVPPGPDTAATPELVGTARAGALYHVVQMASVLTEAVTVRDVCLAVAEQLLPAFGAQEIALYTIRDSRMHLLWESGYPEHFLDGFEGVPLTANLPGVHAPDHPAPALLRVAGGTGHRLPPAPVGHDERLGVPAADRLRPSGRLLHPRLERAAPVHSRGTHRADRAGRSDRAGDGAGPAVRRRVRRGAGAAGGLLPHRLPAIDGLLSTGRYLPGTQGMAIGGDWYDVIRTGRGGGAGHRRRRGAQRRRRRRHGAAAQRGARLRRQRPAAAGGHHPHQPAAGGAGDGPLRHLLLHRARPGHRPCPGRPGGPPPAPAAPPRRAHGDPGPARWRAARGAAGDRLPGHGAHPGSRQRPRAVHGRARRDARR
ncbi:hypothetical protein GCM10023238_39890 [Streptomyces heliomycini]